MLKSAVAGLSRVVNTVAMTANALGTLVVLALVVILNVDVFMRGPDRIEERFDSDSFARISPASRGRGLHRRMPFSSS